MDVAVVVDTYKELRALGGKLTKSTTQSAPLGPAEAWQRAPVRRRGEGGYPAYWVEIVRRPRPGGLAGADNAGSETRFRGRRRTATASRP